MRTLAVHAVATAVRPLVLVVLLTGCREPPPEGPPHLSDGEYTVRGGERLAWRQQAPSAAELARYAYSAYVDGERQLLVDARCRVRREMYSCSARLPALSPGRHILELTTHAEVAGRMVESARSAPIVVVRIGAAATPDEPIDAGQDEFAAGGIRYRLERVAVGLSRPAALAFTPDGRLLIAQRGGTVHIVDGGRMFSEEPLAVESRHDAVDLTVHDLELDPEFHRTRFLLILYSLSSGSETSTRLVRFREIGNTLGEPQVLRDEFAPHPSGPRAAMTFGRDGRLYVATAALQQPVAIGQNRLSGRWWMVQRSPTVLDPATSSRVDTVHRPRAADATLYTGSVLPVFRDSLVIVSADDEDLEWLRFDAVRQRWVYAGVLRPKLGRLGAVREGPDGLLYVGTDNDLPTRNPGQDRVLRIVPADR